MGTYDSIPPSGSEFWQDAVDTFVDLPAGTVIGEARVAQDSGVIYIWDGLVWNAVAGGGTGTITGGVNVGTGPTGPFKDVVGPNLRFRSYDSSDGSVVISISDTTDFTVDPNIVVTSGTINAALGLTANSFVFSDPTGNIVAYGDWNINSTTHASNVILTYQPNNLIVTQQSHAWYTNIDPLQDSPSDSFNLHNAFVNLDSSATGFDFGTNGDAVNIIAGGVNNFGNGSTYGRIRYVNMFSTIGNGTDPVTLMGLAAHNSSLSISANATIDGNCTGYDFNVNVNASATTTSNFTLSVLTDFSQIANDLYGYQGIILQPTVATVKNNSNFMAININPTVVDFEGNSGFQGIYIGGTITNQGSSQGYQGLNLNPFITHLTQNSTGLNLNCTTTDGTADWYGVNISTNNVVTTGQVKGLNIFTGPGQIAIDSTGHNNLQSGFSLVSGQGQMYGNVIGGEIIVPNATAITGTDTLANNMAYTVNTGDATSSWTAATIVGLTTLGFVGQIIGDGTVNGAINFCLNGFADAHTGHIDRVNNFMAAAIPTGAGGTIDEMVHYLATQPAGYVATDNWAFRADDSLLQSYMPMLAIGDMTSKKVTNTSVALEIDSTSKALVHARMTNAQRDALTAIAGMEIFSTDDNAVEYYDGTVWVIS